MSNIADKIKVKQDTDGMLHRALERIIQLYTDKSHFVYELLQNAEDCEATKIKFIQHDKYLEVYHNGKPFTEANLSGLCDIGKSDKVDDLNQIGEFGVGFKSVYGICDTVKLYSDPSHYPVNMPATVVKFAVQIFGFISPQDIEYKEIPEEYTTRFVFPYSVGKNYSGFKSIDSLNETLSKKLSDLGITTLLFMKNLELIEYEIDTVKVKDHGQYSLDKECINDHCKLVSAKGSDDNSGENEQQEISFLLFSRFIDNTASRTVDIAFPVIVDENNNYEFVKAINPYVSVYFPTETESKLDFIVQGPYRTTPNRSSIPFDDKDNIHLAEETSILLTESLVELRDSNKLDMTLLRLLPFDAIPFDTYPLFKPLCQAVKHLFITDDSIIPCRNSRYEYREYTSRHKARIARQERLPSLLSDSLLSELIGDGNDYHWLPPVLTETNKEYERVTRFFVGAEMHVPVIRPEDMKQLISANERFLPRRNDEWLIELYSMFENIPTSFQKSKSDNLLTVDFVKTSKGDFVAPYRKVDNKQYIPNVFLPTSRINSDQINFVDENLYRNCTEFFESVLALRKPDEYQFFVDDFKRRYSDMKKLGDRNVHISDIKKLVKFSRNEEYAAEVSILIKDYLYLMCDDGIIRMPGNQHLYVPETEKGVKIKQYFLNLGKRSYFIDQAFYKENGINEEDLLILKVKNTLIESTSIVEGPYETGSRGRIPTWSTPSDFRWKMTIYSLKDALMYISAHPSAADSYFKSQAIFLELMNNDNKLQGDVVISGSTPNLEDETCAAIKILKGEKTRDWNGKWLYTASQELVSPKEISKYDLPVEIYGKINLDSVLFSVLGFKKTDEDEVEALKKSITKKQVDQLFESELLRRFGVSSIELMSKMSADNSDVSPSNEKPAEFPVSNIRSWDALRKHAAEMLSFANPVKYDRVLRSIRVSNHSNEKQAYLRGMYRITGTHRFVCQMCHDTIAKFDAVEIFNKPENELDPVNLCLCPTCARFYREFRNDKELMKEFRELLISISDNDITDDDCVVICLDDQELWFTQTHFAEVRELLRLEDKAKAAVANPEKDVPEVIADGEKPAMSVYSEYIGKRITRERDGLTGIITGVQDANVVVDVKAGPKDKLGKPLLIGIDYLFSDKGIYTIE